MGSEYEGTYFYITGRVIDVWGKILHRWQHLSCICGLHRALYSILDTWSTICELHAFFLDRKPPLECNGKRCTTQIPCILQCAIPVKSLLSVCFAFGRTDDIRQLSVIEWSDTSANLSNILTQPSFLSIHRQVFLV